MSRIAIVGSCITRDLWPILGEAPPGLIYVSRTSLPSLLAPAAPGLIVSDEPVNGLKRHQHAATVADLRKSALAELAAHRPTHLIFDFIDERFDLLRAQGTLITHSWELATSGYLDQPALAGAHRIPRVSEGCERLWLDALQEMAVMLRATPLRDAKIILHAAQWATTYVTKGGDLEQFDPVLEIFPGVGAEIQAHNALLDRYQAAFRAATNCAVVRASPDVIRSDEGHRWGLTPFHYVGEYYAQILAQLAELGC